MTLPDLTAPAPAGPKRTPFLTDAVRLVRVLFSPTAVFEEQRDAPTFWIPWVIVSVLLVGVSMLNFPFTLAMARLGAAAKGQPFPAAAETIMRVSQFVAVPIVTLIVLLLVAGLMYIVLLAAGGEVRYKGLLSVAVFTGLIGVLQLVATHVVWALRSHGGELSTLADYQVSFGLDLFLPQDASLGKFADGLLRGITPFSVWGLLITGFGVRAMERTTKGAAWTAASVSFLLGVCLTAIGNVMNKG